MREPFISIVVPTYNVAPYIYDCLSSVASQTYKGQMECLIVDDCGTDNSMNIVENFVNEYNGNIDYRIIRRRENGGLSVVRNMGIKEAKGDFLYFLDSDDCIIPNCIELMVSCIHNYPETECVFAGAKASKGYEWMSYERKGLPLYSNNPKWIIAALSCRYILNMTAWNRLINREFLLHHNLFFEDGYVHEDEIWTQDLAQKLQKIAICPYDTYLYTVRNTGIIAKENGNQMFESRMRVWHHMLERLPKNAATPLLGSLFNTQNHWDLDSGRKKLHLSFLKEVACNSSAYPCRLARIYLALPDRMRKSKTLQKIFLKWIEPLYLYKKTNPYCD